MFQRGTVINAKADPTLMAYKKKYITQPFINMAPFPQNHNVLNPNPCIMSGIVLPDSFKYTALVPFPLLFETTARPSKC